MNNLTASVYTTDDTDYRFPIWQSSKAWDGRKNFYSGDARKPKSYLLTNTVEKVQSIAEMVGYSNVSYFSTIFKKKYGVNPYEFRRNNVNKYTNYDNK